MPHSTPLDPTRPHSLFNQVHQTVHANVGLHTANEMGVNIRFSLPICTYAPWGVRVDGLTKSGKRKKLPTQKMPPLVFVSRTCMSFGSHRSDWSMIMEAPRVA